MSKKADHARIAELERELGFAAGTYDQIDNAIQKDNVQRSGLFRSWLRSYAWAFTLDRSRTW